MKYNVKITKVLEGYAEIEAANAEAAVKEAEGLYSGGAELPDMEDTLPLSFCVEPENRKETVQEHPSQEEIANYLKKEGFPDSSMFMVRQFVYGNNASMFDEAVRNNYTMNEVERWVHLKNILGSELSYRAAMVIDTALWIEDLDTMNTKTIADILDTPKGLVKSRLEKVASEYLAGEQSYRDYLKLSVDDAVFLVNAFGLAKEPAGKDNMDISIYQINSKRDPDRLCFMNFNFISKHQGGGINASIYDKVFDGTVNAVTLEDVYRIFNIDHPADYRGRSLSVSDVVEVREDSASHFYFCDSFGFRRISFDPQLAGARDGLKPSLASKIDTFSAQASEASADKQQKGRTDPER